MLAVRSVTPRIHSHVADRSLSAGRPAFFEIANTGVVLLASCTSGRTRGLTPGPDCGRKVGEELRVDRASMRDCRHVRVDTVSPECMRYHASVCTQRRGVTHGPPSAWFLAEGLDRMPHGLYASSRLDRRPCCCCRGKGKLCSWETPGAGHSHSRPARWPELWRLSVSTPPLCRRRRRCGWLSALR